MRELEDSYERYLNEVVDAIFERAAKVWTWTELAQMAGVSYTTVWKLGTRATRLPQLRTMFLLAQAVNMDLPPIKRKLKGLAKQRDRTLAGV